MADQQQEAPMFDTRPTAEELANRILDEAPQGFDENWDRCIGNLASVLITSWDRLNRKEQRMVFDVARQIQRYRTAGTMPPVANPIAHHDDGSYSYTLRGSPECTIVIHPSAVAAEEQVAEGAPAE